MFVTCVATEYTCKLMTLMSLVAGSTTSTATTVLASHRATSMYLNLSPCLTSCLHKCGKSPPDPFLNCTAQIDDASNLDSVLQCAESLPCLLLVQSVLSSQLLSSLALTAPGVGMPSIPYTFSLLLSDSEDWVARIFPCVVLLMTFGKL